ncbi:imelysin family protein [Agarivorans sp. QJM3NY_29]|uniref:imelysin family protein n=1 Tax=unclassified Agarivorans TaxID=2636026 RepID=UPI003D7DB5B2
MNIYFLRVLTFSLLGLLGLTSVQADNNPRSLWLKQEQQYISGLGGQLLEAAQAYQQQVVSYCAAPSAAALAASQQAWQANYQAYLPLQASALGPLLDLKLNWAISYWPDKKDTTGRKVKAALSVAEPKLSTTHSNLRSQAYLLFSELTAKQRCDVLSSQFSRYLPVVTLVSKGLQSLAIHQDQAPLFPQLSSDLLNSYRLQSSIMLRKYRALYSEKHQRLRPYQGEAWRANISLHLLNQQLALLQQRYTKYLAVYLQQLEPTLAKQVSQQFAAVLASMPQQEPLAEQSDLSAWQQAEPQLARLDSLFMEQIPQALSIDLGFNNNDGD